MIGSLLREARKKSGVSPDEIGTKIGIAPKVVTLIEEEGFSRLGGWVYVKTYGERYLAHFGLLNDETRDMLRREWEIASLKEKRQLKLPTWRDRLAEFGRKNSSFFIAGSAAGFAVFFYFTYQVVTLLSNPPLVIFEPGAQFSAAHENSAVIRGSTREEVKVTINRRPVIVSADGSFNERLYLAPGVNKIVVTASSINGKSDEKSFYVLMTP